MKLIGIAGKARSGKDTLANYLADWRGFESMQFAAPIREAAKQILMLDENTLEGHKETRLNWVDTSYRDFAQKLGTEFARDMIDQDFWIKRMEQFMRLRKPEPLVISDVRFNNEAEWIRSMGGIIIHLERPDAEKVKSHISEAGVAQVGTDYNLMNDDSVQTMFRNADYLLIEMFGEFK